ARAPGARRPLRRASPRPHRPGARSAPPPATSPRSERAQDLVHARSRRPRPRARRWPAPRGRAGTPSIVALDRPERVEKGRQVSGAAGRDEQAALAAELAHQALAGEKQALEPAHLARRELEAAGEAKHVAVVADVTVGAHIHGVDAAVAAEEERADARGF